MCMRTAFEIQQRLYESRQKSLYNTKLLKQIKFTNGCVSSKDADVQRKCTEEERERALRFRMCLIEIEIVEFSIHNPDHESMLGLIVMQEIHHDSIYTHTLTGVMATQECPAHCHLIARLNISASDRTLQLWFTNIPAQTIQYGLFYEYWTMKEWKIIFCIPITVIFIQYISNQEFLRCSSLP